MDLLTYWLGPFERAEMIDPGRARGEEDSEPDVRVRFRRGVVYFLAAREEQYSHYTVELIAPNGRLRYDGGGFRVEWQSAEADPHLAGYTKLSTAAESIASGMARSQWNVAEQLAEALSGASTPYLCSGRTALTTLEFMHQTIAATW